MKYSVVCRIGDTCISIQQGWSFAFGKVLCCDKKKPLFRFVLGRASPVIRSVWIRLFCLFGYEKEMESQNCWCVYRSIATKSYLKLVMLRHTPSPCMPFSSHQALCQFTLQMTSGGPHCLCAWLLHRVVGGFCTGSSPVSGLVWNEEMWSLWPCYPFNENVRFLEPS